MLQLNAKKHVKLLNTLHTVTMYSCV